ncbi:MAG: stress response translation initiation inhibitor YciH [archaeon]
MVEIDKVTGLPKDLLDFGDITKESQKIKVTEMMRRFRKFMTIVSGLEDEKEAKRLGKELKRKLACGGTVKGTKIELQGKHSAKVKEILLANGYREELIDA